MIRRNTMQEEYNVSLTQFIEKMNLKNHTPEIDTDKIFITDPDINRPALQLAGFFEHFDNTRIQICGNVEHAYLADMHTREENEEIFDPCHIDEISAYVTVVKIIEVSAHYE